VPTLRESIVLSITGLKRERATLETAHRTAVAALESRLEVLSTLHRLLNERFDPDEFDAAYSAAVKLGMIPDIATPDELAR
jgi:hypothetical protein